MSEDALGEDALGSGSGPAPRRCGPAAGAALWAALLLAGTSAGAQDSLILRELERREYELGRQVREQQRRGDIRADERREDMRRDEAREMERRRQIEADERRALDRRR